MIGEVAEVLGWLDGPRVERLAAEVDGLLPRHVRTLRDIVAELPSDVSAWGPVLAASLAALGAAPEVVESSRLRHGWAFTWRAPVDDVGRPPWALRALARAVVAAPVARVPAIELDAVEVASGYLARAREVGHVAAGVRLLLRVARSAVEVRSVEVLGGWTALRVLLGAHDVEAVRELVVEGERAGLWSYRVEDIGDGTNGRRVRIIVNPGPPLASHRRMFAPLPGPHDLPPLVGGKRGHGPQWALFALVFPALRPLALDALDHGGAFDLPESWWRDLAERARLPRRNLAAVRSAYLDGTSEAWPVLVVRADGRFAVAPYYAHLGDTMIEGGKRSAAGRMGGKRRAASATRIAGRFGLTEEIDA